MVRGALGNADLPFTCVVEAAGVPRSAAHSPLFQVMCVLQDASPDQEVAMEGLRQEAVEVLARAVNLAGTLQHRELAALCNFKNDKYMSECCVTVYHSRGGRWSLMSSKRGISNDGGSAGGCWHDGRPTDSRPGGADDSEHRGHGPDFGLGGA